MSKVTQAILTIILILAALGYTVFNYSQGKIDMTFLVVSAAILLWPLVNIVRGLINELKNK